MTPSPKYATKSMGLVASSSGIVSTLQAMMDLMGGDKTIRQLENASNMSGACGLLGDNLSRTVTDAEQIAGLALVTPQLQPGVTAIPPVGLARTVGGGVQARDGGLLKVIRRAPSRTLQQTQEYQTLARDGEHTGRAPKLSRQHKSGRRPTHQITQMRSRSQRFRRRQRSAWRQACRNWSIVVKRWA